MDLNENVGIRHFKLGSLSVEVDELYGISFNEQDQRKYIIKKG